MKRTLSSLSLILILGACNTTPPVEPQEPAQVDTPAETAMLSIDGITFDLPSEWIQQGSVEKSDKEIYSATIEVPDAQYQVALVLSVSKSESATYSPENTLKRDGPDVIVYQDSCDGAFGCYLLHKRADPVNEIYKVSFRVSSDQAVPEDADGMWSPTTEVTKEELINFLATAR